MKSIILENNSTRAKEMTQEEQMIHLREGGSLIDIVNPTDLTCLYYIKMSDIYTSELPRTASKLVILHALSNPAFCKYEGNRLDEVKYVLSRFNMLPRIQQKWLRYIIAVHKYYTSYPDEFRGDYQVWADKIDQAIMELL